MNNKYNRGLTLLELVIFIAMLGVLAFILLPALDHRSEGPRGSSCANNLKQFGLSLKMYANENRGEMYPPMQVEITRPRAVNPNHPNPSKWNSFTYTFAPRIYAIYPEYMSDVKVTICRTDASNRLADREVDELSCVIYDNSWDEGSTDPNITEGCMDNLGDSYVYLSWVFDKIGEDDARSSGLPQTWLDSWQSIEQDMEFNAPPDSNDDSFWFPTQLIETLTAAQNRAWPLLDVAFTNTDAGHRRFMDVWNDDQTISENPDVELGNGNSNTVFRLRDGIERFLITDIGNPGASAKARSLIPILMDTPATYPAGFNHIPGGSNVLFIDGHVEFIRYREKTPVNDGVARTLLPIINHDFTKGILK
jgi:prepilin-type processing-associated H-X9-DG protein